MCIKSGKRDFGEKITVRSMLSRFSYYQFWIRTLYLSNEHELGCSIDESVLYRLEGIDSPTP